MRFSALVSIALAAGSAMAAPAAVLRGHLHLRDHYALLRRSQDSSVEASLALHARDTDPSNANAIVETVFVQPSATQEIAYVTEIAMVTVMVDQYGSTFSPSWTGAADTASSSSSSSSQPTTLATSQASSQISEAVDSAAGLASSSSTAAPSSSPSSSSQVETSAVQSSSAQSASSTSASSSAWSSSSSSSSASPSTSSASSSVSAPSSSASSSPSPSATSAPGQVPNTITYSPYNDDSSCKSADQVYADLKKLHDVGISAIRVYGTDCNSISTVQPACVSLGLKIDQGFWIGPQGVDSIDSGVQELISWVQNNHNNDWSIFTTITVGNEAIFGGFIDGPTLLSKIKSVKSTLQAAGWTGTVTTAEPPGSYVNFPDLCTDTSGIDYVGVNAHPYFDASGSPDQAGSFVLAQISAVQAACNNRNVKITETGYPMAGNANGNQVPTPENQATAIASIMKATNNEAVMFTVFNDKWKNPGPYNVEQNFGILHLFT